MTHNNRGFTLVELLVGLAVTSLAMTAIYSTYMSQQRSFTVQQQLANMNQSLRAAMYLISSELKMAGYDPTKKAGAGIESLSEYTNATQQASIRFTKDDNNNGAVTDTGEDLTYAYYLDGDVPTLSRKNPTADEPVADYIERFHLTFLDSGNAVTTDPDKVRSVQITLVARTENKDNDYTSNFSYQDLQGNTYVITTPVGYRRNVLSMQVNCRNLGLQ